jgi:hypothetical protein
MKVASQNIPRDGKGVVTVSLAENGLRDVRGVEQLSMTFPNLRVSISFDSHLNQEPKFAAQQYLEVE